jgi:hypothetical protein
MDEYEGYYYPGRSLGEIGFSLRPWLAMLISDQEKFILHNFASSEDEPWVSTCYRGLHQTGNGTGCFAFEYDLDFTSAYQLVIKGAKGCGGSYDPMENYRWRN